MKTAFSLCLACVVVTSASAQIFRPEAVNGALLGGIAGAVIGNNSGDLGHNAWKGAALGAGAGLILGEAAGNARAASRDPQVYSSRRGDYVYRDAPSVRIGVGYGSVRGHGHGYFGGGRGYYGRGGSYFGVYSPGYRYDYAPSYGYYGGYGAGYPYYDSYGHPGSGSAAANGLWLGALAGGILGHNSGDFRHNAWRGAAWGAGAGWLLGSIVDANRRPVVYESAPAPAAPPAAPQQITIINNYYNATPMSGANSLFGR
jgi:uncharacterized protein YcfJ